MKAKWWLIPVAFVLILVIAAAIFWNTISIYIAPKAVLTAALADTFQALQQRYESGPLPILINGIDAEFKNTIDMQLQSDSELLGAIQYDMRIQTEQNPRRIQADGEVTFQNKQIDLSVYLDNRFAALSSAEVLQGKYYGLTYDQFAEDAANSLILQLLVKQDTLQKWQESIDSLKEIMNQSISLPVIPNIQAESLILGIAAMDVEVEREVLLLGSQQMPCFAISMDTTGAQVLQGLDLLQAQLPVSIEKDADISLSFWLYDGAIIKTELEIDSASKEAEITLLLGENPAEDDIQLLIQDESGYREISVSTIFEEDLFDETVTIRKVQNNLPSDLKIQYCWNPANGEVDLSITKNNQKSETRFTLEALPDGFLVTTADFESLMHLLIGTKDAGNSACSMAVTKGADFPTPEYKNFSQWSLEDMLLLASGIGGLLGIQIS